jgi:DNA-binding NarL/FixJ family response regulator
VLPDTPQAAGLRLMMMNILAGQLLEADRFDAAGALLREAMALAERSGTYRLGAVCAVTAEYYFETGQWDDALVLLETAMGIPGAGYVPVIAHGQTALIAAHRDDWATAQQHLAAVQDQDIATPLMLSMAGDLLEARALAAERAGDLPAAVAVLAIYLNPELTANISARYPLLRLLVRLALAAGDAGTARAAAESAAEDAVAQAVTGQLPAAAAAADVCRGLVTGDPGPLLTAARYYESAGRPFDRAQALEEAAVLLAGQGELEEAREAFAASAAGYQALGATFDLRRADVRLRALGIRRARRGRRQAPVHGWEALTPTERVIAGLVAQGRSNPDIAAELVLSRSTVQTHVSHILAKLGARSRADILRRALHARSEG